MIPLREPELIAPTTDSYITSQLAEYPDGSSTRSDNKSRIHLPQTSHSMAHSSRSAAPDTASASSAPTTAPNASAVRVRRNGSFGTARALMPNQACVWRFEGLVAGEKIEFNFSEVLLEHEGDILLISAYPFRETNKCAEVRITY